MEPDFEIEGKNVDAAHLAEEVKRRVTERREKGAYTRDVEALLAERLPDEEYDSQLAPLALLDYAATRAASSWEVSTAYPVETEKRFLKPVVIFMKRFARLWARIAVGPVQREQSAFNRHVASALDAVRNQAIADERRALADEEDLSTLVEALIDEVESAELAGVCAGGIGDANPLVVLGPCPQALFRALADRGYKLLKVSGRSSWEEPRGIGIQGAGPLAFLGQLPEASASAMLIPEIVFWLKPETLIRLLSRSYLALSPESPIAIAVHSFAAAGGPAPAWCEPAVVERALSLTGFKDPSTSTLPGRRGYVTVARR